MTGPQSKGWWRDHASVHAVRPGRRARSKTRQQVEEWASRARTPETRAEIDRWSRWEAVSFWLMMLCLFFMVSAPVLGLGFGIWGAFDDRAPSWMWGAFGSLGLGVALMTAGAILGSHAKERRLTALYADGRASVGRLDEVITHPGGGEEQTTYEFLISAELPHVDEDGPAVLHRRLYWGEHDGWISPERWVGRQIRFRHNTLDPDALYDVRFDGWPDRGGKVARS